MKNITYTILLALVFVSCGSNDTDVKAKLEKLRAQRSELDSQIAELEKQAMAGDSLDKSSLEVLTEPLSAQTFKSYIEIQGRVDADEHVKLSTEMPGTITKIFVQAGANVTKGQVLAETDTRAMNQQVAELQTNLDLARTAYNKYKNLWDQKIGTEMQYLQSKATLESLEQRMVAMQEQIRMSKIISPIDGTVDEVNIKIGTAVAPGMPAISVVNFSNLKVKADVAESYASRIKSGNEVLILFPDLNDSVKSKVIYASRAINALTRTFNVEVGLDSKQDFHPNMVARLKINDFTSPEPVIALPVKFIQKNSGESYVLVAENGKAVKKTVTIGKEYGGVAVIESGLKVGDLLITQGYDLVDAGDQVSIKK